MRRMPWPVLAALCCLGLTACGGGADVVDAGVAKIYVGQRSSGGDSALLRGPLAVLDGCLGVAERVVVWPHGTTVVREKPLTIRAPGVEGDRTIGDEVQIGGGVAAEPLQGETRMPEPLEIAGLTVPAECAAHGVWISSAP